MIISNRDAKICQCAMGQTKNCKTVYKLISAE